MTTQDNDFKYIMQDVGHIYIGARFSYGELLEHEMVPFKLKTIFSRYMLTQAAQETTLEEQFSNLQDIDLAYETYQELKAKVKLSVRAESKPLFGKTKERYVDKIVTIHELKTILEQEMPDSALFIRELLLPKMSVLSFSI